MSNLWTKNNTESLERMTKIILKGVGNVVFLKEVAVSNLHVQHNIVLVP